MHTWWTWDNQQGKDGKRLSNIIWAWAGQVCGTPIDPQKLVQYLSTAMCEHVWAIIPNKQTCESWWWLMNVDEHFIVFCSWLQFLVARTKVFFGWSEKNRLSNTNFLCANQFHFVSRNLDFAVEFIVRFHPEVYSMEERPHWTNQIRMFFCHFVLRGFAEGLVSRCEIYHSFQESSRYTSPDHKSFDLDASKSQVPCCISRW